MVPIEVAMNPIVVKSEYWDTIVEYYYDNIKWREDAAPDIYDWLERDYSAYSSTAKPWIEFKDPSKHTWFILKFG